MSESFFRLIDRAFRHVDANEPTNAQASHDPIKSSRQCHQTALRQGLSHRQPGSERAKDTTDEDPRQNVLLHVLLLSFFCCIESEKRATVRKEKDIGESRYPVAQSTIGGAKGNTLSQTL